MPAWVEKRVLKENTQYMDKLTCGQLLVAQTQGVTWGISGHDDEATGWLVAPDRKTTTGAEHADMF